MQRDAQGNIDSAAASVLLDSTFRKKRVGHRIVKETRDRLMHEILTSPRERVIALIGPSGVGKTLVVKNLQELLVHRYMEEMKEDPGFLPFISATTVTGLNGSYDWRDGFARLLTAANEPLIGLKRSVPAYELDGQKLTTTKGLLKNEFRRSFESLVKNRRVRVVFLDEGSAIIDETVNRHPLRQFNILKSLAVSLGIVIVLIGAYDLAGLNDGNGQLLGRSNCIHMPRYRPDLSHLQAAVEGRGWGLDKNDKADDLTEFMNAVLTLAGAAPVTFDPDVLADAPSLVIKSVGCIGNARNWIDRASSYALVYNNGRVTRALFDRVAVPNHVALKLTREAQLGESLLADCPEHELAHHFGLSGIRAQADTTTEAPPTRRRGSSTVGKRGPSRDPVGITRA